MRNGYLLGLMLADFEIRDLANKIFFCLAVLVSLEKDINLDDNKLEVSEKDWRGNLDAFFRRFLRSNQ